jgi:hypothetical protein
MLKEMRTVFSFRPEQSRTGKHIIVVWEHVEDDPRTIKPVTAYEVPPQQRQKR